MEMNKKVEELLKAPLLIATVRDETLLAQINNLLPYSTGFEIEGNYSPLFNEVNFTSIPYIMEVNCNGYEQRFRIPNGIMGIVCLYLIARQLRINCALNMDSGIHYHVDCTDVSFKDVQEMAKSNQGYIIGELISWGYHRAYNTRGVGSSHYWLRFNDLRTFEFRIGEMTFDYNLLLKRILHANEITRYVKSKMANYKEPTYQSCDFKTIFKHMKLPYSLTAYSTESYTHKLGIIQKQLNELDKKPVQEELHIRKRRHIL